MSNEFEYYFMLLKDIATGSPFMGPQSYVILRSPNASYQKMIPATMFEEALINEDELDYELDEDELDYELDEDELDYELDDELDEVNWVKIAKEIEDKEKYQYKEMREPRVVSITPSPFTKDDMPIVVKRRLPIVIELKQLLPMPPPFD